ncbi:metallophosphoesterase [Paenibacillus pinistramenti]|uniref:metallophosphoesterase n=1 Tax=Paenibacillus pinistramenti TaxID=1768003 RepID=UPI00110938F4|nr:metallophosphoesterase [Paenibacillus pinistramenti]
MRLRALPLILLLFLLVSCAKASVPSPRTTLTEDEPSPAHLKLYVATDLHLLAPSLHDNGAAFQTYIHSGDSKLLQYSDALMNAWVAQVIRDHPDAVVISGDLTNNGEKESHRWLKDKLKSIEDSGIPVYVIPGNHDISNPWARNFRGDQQYKAASVTPEEFSTNYAPFGYSEAFETDNASLSYVIKLTKDLWLLMLDTSQYSNNQALGYPQTDGELASSTLAWVQHIGELSKSNGAKIIAVMHHNLFDHSDFSSSDFTLNNNGETLNVLEQSNIHLVLSGHIHIQDIQTKDHVSDIATSAFEVYPHQFGVLEYSTETASLSYHTQPIDVASWAEATNQTNPDLLGFAAYAKDFFRNASYTKAIKALEGQGYTETEQEQMAAVMAELNLHYFAGTMDTVDPGVLKSAGMQLWQNAEPQFIKNYVLSMGSKTTGNNSLTVNLSSGAAR